MKRIIVDINRFIVMKDDAMDKAVPLDELEVVGAYYKESDYLSEHESQVTDFSVMSNSYYQYIFRQLYLLVAYIRKYEFEEIVIRSDRVLMNAMGFWGVRNIESNYDFLGLSRPRLAGFLYTELNKYFPGKVVLNTKSKIFGAGFIFNIFNRTFLLINEVLRSLRFVLLLRIYFDFGKDRKLLFCRSKSQVFYSESLLERDPYIGIVSLYAIHGRSVSWSLTLMAKLALLLALFFGSIKRVPLLLGRDSLAAEDRIYIEPHLMAGLARLFFRFGIEILTLELSGRYYEVFKKYFDDPRLRLTQYVFFKLKKNLVPYRQLAQMVFVVDDITKSIVHEYSYFRSANFLVQKIDFSAERQRSETNRLVLFATQPYEPFVTRKFLECLAAGLRSNGISLLLKRHPRDKSDYGKWCEVVELGSFPEVLKLHRPGLVLSRTSSVSTECSMLGISSAYVALSEFDERFLTEQECEFLTAAEVLGFVKFQFS